MRTDAPLDLSEFTSVGLPLIEIDDPLEASTSAFLEAKTRIDEPLEASTLAFSHSSLSIETLEPDEASSVRDLQAPSIESDEPLEASTVRFPAITLPLNDDPDDASTDVRFGEAA